LPHPAWGTDSHLYFGWRHGEWRDLARAAAVWPAAVRFVSELGAQAVPSTAAFMGPERWPDLDWENLTEHHCLQKEIFDERVPPAQYPTFESWREATQAYQARLVRAQVEALRRLRSGPVGGFAVFCLSDAQPAVSSAIVDHGPPALPSWWCRTGRQRAMRRRQAWPLPSTSSTTSAKPWSVPRWRRP
jgi:beta-mannosidase